MTKLEIRGAEVSLDLPDMLLFNKYWIVLQTVLFKVRIDVQLESRRERPTVSNTPSGPSTVGN